MAAQSAAAKGLTITFWGVRGSVPCPGRATLRYGGNTPCVSVETDDLVLVLDAGTGIRELGKHLTGTAKTIVMLVTHPHFDHVLGFPFFAPLYEPGRELYLFDYVREGHRWSLLDLLNGFHFPVASSALPARCIRVDPSSRLLQERGFSLSQVHLNHPGGAMGYRIGFGGCSVVYISDNELVPLLPPTTPLEAIVSFCRGCDVLIHDAQYVPANMPMKRGWGHSLVSEACALAQAAQVGELVLFHHDPDRSDDELDAIQAEACAALTAEGIRCTVAYETLQRRLPVGEDAVNQAATHPVLD